MKQMLYIFFSQLRLIPAKINRNLLVNYVFSATIFIRTFVFKNKIHDEMKSYRIYDVLQETIKNYYGYKLIS